MALPDPIITPSQGIALVSSIFKGVWNNVQDRPQWILDKIRNSDPFGIEAKKYVNNIFETHNSMKIIGMSEPTPLSDIYINVNVKSKTDLGMFLLESFWQKKTNFESGEHYSERLQPAEKVISEEKRVIILGRPGAGKTTFLKYLAISSLNKSDINAIPIFVSLKDWSKEKNVNLETMLIRQF